MKTTNTKQAFNLVEIAIAVAIIILISTLSVHGLLHARIVSNEAAAVNNLKTLHSALVSYRIVNTAYPQNLADLGFARPPYLDSTLAEGSKQGYDFELLSGDNTFLVIATPQQYGVTGNRIFYIDEKGEVAQANLGSSAGILNTNEGAAVRGLLALRSGFQAYIRDNGVYPSTIGTLRLRDPYLNNLLSRLAYDFQIQNADPDTGSFQIVAISPGNPDRSFYIDNNGVISEVGGGGGGRREQTGPL